MIEKQAQYKMGVCYTNTRKIYTECTPSVCNSLLRLLSDKPLTVTTVATSLFSASVIYIFNPTITRA